MLNKNKIILVYKRIVKPCFSKMLRLRYTGLYFFHDRVLLKTRRNEYYRLRYIFLLNAGVLYTRIDSSFHYVLWL